MYTKNSDVLEIEDNIMLRSNSVTHDLPNVEDTCNTFIIYFDIKFVN